MKEERRKPWGLIIFVLIGLFLISTLFVGIISLSSDIDVELLSGNVALIPIRGVIRVDSVSGWGGTGASSEELVEFIEKADSNPKIKAILFDINSPGGAPVASDEIADAVKRTNKTTVSVIREVGASGAYWIASASDHIVANRMSITGSIGVVGSYLEIAGFMQDHNFTHQRLVSGEYKDMGNPLKELTPNERVILQGKLDIIHDYFIEGVAENRGLPEEQVKELATGVFYLGSEAKDLGLVDVLGGKKEAIDYIETELNITAEIAEYERQIGFLEALSGVIAQSSFNLGKGITSGTLDNKGPAVWT